jgi:uridylate kinase
MSKQTVLIKLTGEIFLASRGSDKGMGVDSSIARALARQIKQLLVCYNIGIVIGGGNFFRGRREGVDLGIEPTISHQIGMLATVMNGLILHNVLDQEGVSATLFTALEIPLVGKTTSFQEIKAALTNKSCLIFTGGTGNPFFSTDTAAIVRALQMNAQQVWKATNVEGIYDADPRIHPGATLLPHTTFSYAIDHRLGIMDATALLLAQEHHLPIRVFSSFTPNALLRAAEDPTFGTTITS